jgi:tripartite-type tricarboxylate transporter receptor subunit TctC
MTNGFVLAAALLVWSGAAQAQLYPAKPIRLIVPFVPGGPTDLVARTVGHKLTEAWGQQVIVENRPGANGLTGTEVAAKSPPDGYTLLLGTNGTHGMNPSLFPRVPYDAERDFAPITRLVQQYFMLVAHPSLPARSVKELVQLARARPGELNCSAGGSPTQLGAELFKRAAKIDMVVVPYKGNAAAVTAVMSGEVSLVFGAIALAGPQVKAGRLRALGMASPRRSQVMPEVPTIAESGLPGFEVGAWYGLLAPAGTPRAVIERVSAESARILKLPDVRERFRADAFDIAADTPEQFAAVIRAELARWAPIVKAAGIKPE